MRETAVDVLVYLFEHYIDQPTFWELRQDDEDFDISVELKAAGFDQNAVEVALNWLEELPEMASDQNVFTAPAPQSIRIYTAHEQAMLGTECLNFLMEMERLQLLQAQQREAVLERVRVLDAETVELEHFKWLICLVLFNHADEGDSEQQAQLHQLEDWIYAGDGHTAQ